jgi:dTDP-4-amino-4,6-dideoxygalactose transaminase
MIECGWKYNMDNIQAALLLPQLRKIDSYWAKRKHIYDIYMSGIGKLPYFDYPKIVKNSKSAYHLFTVWSDSANRDAILHGLGEAGIGVAVNYRAIHLLKFFSEKFGFKKGDFPAAEDISSRTVSLPFYTELSNEEIRYITEVLTEIIL